MEYQDFCPVFTRSEKESQRPSCVLDDYFWLNYREWMGDLWLNNAGCSETFFVCSNWSYRCGREMCYFFCKILVFKGEVQINIV